MQEFLMDYGLWLLIALLIVIGIVFLLSGKRKNAPPVPDAPAVIEESAPPAPVAALTATEPAIAAEPVAFAEPAVPVETPVIVEEAAVPVEPAAPPAVAAPAEGADDLLKLKGVGPKLAALLTELGVTRYAQIAGWNESDIAAIDAKLGNFKGRPVRDQWIDQARYLAAGDIAGFEAKYGKL